MLRRIKNMRAPARRAMGFALSFLFLLTAVAVAVPLLALPVLTPVTAVAAVYPNTTVGLQQALTAGDNVQAAQILAAIKGSAYTLSAGSVTMPSGTSASTGIRVQCRNQFPASYDAYVRNTSLASLLGTGGGLAGITGLTGLLGRTTDPTGLYFIGGPSGQALLNTYNGNVHTTTYNNTYLSSTNVTAANVDGRICNRIGNINGNWGTKWSNNWSTAPLSPAPFYGTNSDDGTWRYYGYNPGRTDGASGSFTSPALAAGYTVNHDSPENSRTFTAALADAATLGAIPANISLKNRVRLTYGRSNNGTTYMAEGSNTNSNRFTYYYVWNYLSDITCVETESVNGGSLLHLLQDCFYINNYPTGAHDLPLGSTGLTTFQVPGPKAALEDKTAAQMAADYTCAQLKAAKDLAWDTLKANIMGYMTVPGWFGPGTTGLNRVLTQTEADFAFDKFFPASTRTTYEANISAAIALRAAVNDSGHVLGAAATCSDAQICSVCARVFAPIVPNNHVNQATGFPYAQNDAEVTLASTCVATGKGNKRCEGCNAVVGEYTVAVNAANHLDQANGFAPYGTKNGSVTTASTCMDEGVRDMLCVACDAPVDTAAVAIDPDNHYDLAAGAPYGTNDDITLDPDCSATGLKDLYCDGCGECVARDVTVPLDALNHGSYGSEDVITLKPNCTDTGLKNVCCKGCEAIFDEDVELAALGHSWGQWVTVRQATKDQPGEARRECQREDCSAFETREIAYQGGCGGCFSWAFDSLMYFFMGFGWLGR